MWSPSIPQLSFLIDVSIQELFAVDICIHTHVCVCSICTKNVEASDFRNKDCDRNGFIDDDNLIMTMMAFIMMTMMTMMTTTIRMMMKKMMVWWWRWWLWRWWARSDDNYDGEGLVFFTAAVCCAPAFKLFFKRNQFEKEKRKFSNKNDFLLLYQSPKEIEKERKEPQQATFYTDQVYTNRRLHHQPWFTPSTGCANHGLHQTPFIPTNRNPPHTPTTACTNHGLHQRRLTPTTAYSQGTFTTTTIYAPRGSYKARFAPITV